MPNPPPPELKGYFDENGQLLKWPSRGRPEKRDLALAWLASHFVPDRSYAEKEVNEILNSLHTFGDHAFLRRELVDKNHLTRTPDGTIYRRKAQEREA